MTYALTADKILRQHAEGSVQSGEDGEDRAVVDAVLAAGESAPLRTLYRAIKLAKAKQRAADKSDGAVQRSRYTKKPKSRSREWTPEEDELLERLVEKHVDLPDPTIWYRVSGGTIDGKILLRAGPACMRRWRALYPPPLARAGRWSAEEELRLQKAISEQFEGKYQVLIDVLPDSPSAQAKGEVQEYLEKQHLQQLPSQSSLPILKQGSRRLRMLNWVMIADRVQSRSDCDCRGHFYTVYHNGNRGAWSREELERMKEGVEMFGKDYWKIAEHVGTRSSIQVNKLACFQRAKEKEMRAADQRQKARETKQLQKE
ncbi:Myblike DNAbinding domain-containing protein [Mortierella sp. 14UC]|nr:Myblike DNAbinding domain-containing protein [Mortierella sp. 14UC]